MVPSRRHRVSRSWTDFHFPYRSGNSRHWDPVCRIHRIPLRVVRWSFHWPPRLPLAGIRSAITANWASVNS